MAKQQQSFSIITSSSLSMTSPRQDGGKRFSPWTTCYLLAVPSEIRLRIYEHVFVGLGYTDVFLCKQRRSVVHRYYGAQHNRTALSETDQNMYEGNTRRLQSSRALLKTCRTIHNEVKPLYYKQTQLTLYICPDICRNDDKEASALFKHLRNGLRMYFLDEIRNITVSICDRPGWYSSLERQWYVDSVIRHMNALVDGIGAGTRVGSVSCRIRNIRWHDDEVLEYFRRRCAKAFEELRGSGIFSVARLLLWRSLEKAVEMRERDECGLLRIDDLTPGDLDEDGSQCSEKSWEFGRRGDRNDEARNNALRTKQRLKIM